MDARTYLDALLQALARLQPDPTTDAAFVRGLLRDRIYPMILEWSALPFLPPAHLIVLFDGYMQPSAAAARPDDRWIVECFAQSLATNDGVPLMALIEEELEGLGSLPVRQAVRARALAIACPTAALDGSYLGSIPELRALIKDDTLFRGLRPPRPAPDDVFLNLDLRWMCDQVKTWTSSAVRGFLSGRLRPKDAMRERARAGADPALRAVIDTLKAAVEARSPRLETPDALCEAVRARPSGPLEEAVLRRVLPLVAVEDPAWAHQALPTGGYADLSTRGTVDRLLPSLLAYPDDEFNRRFVENELLYYELEAPPARHPPAQVVLLDASPPTWGLPRVAGAALALAVVNRARERRADALVLGAGRLDRPFENLDRAGGVFELLDHQRWDESLAADLDALAERLRADAKGRPSGADVFVCTEAGRREAVDAWARRADLPPSVRLHLFAMDVVDGRCFLARREGGGFVPLATLSLAAKDLQPAAPEGAPPAPAGAHFPPDLQVDWDWGGNVLCAALGPDGLAVTGHDNGELHVWDALRGLHLGHRATLPQPVVSIALSGRTFLGVLARDGMLQGLSTSLFAGSVDGDAVDGVAAQGSARERSTVRAGWLPGQFFWWKSDRELVEHHVSQRRTIVHAGCRKPPAQPFLVMAAEKRLYWKADEGLVAFDLKEVAAVPRHRARTAIADPVRHLAVDPTGRLAVRMRTSDPRPELLWLSDRPSPVYADALLPSTQPPKAASGDCDRLIGANTSALWFWTLAQPRLVAKRTACRQRVRAVTLGQVQGSKAVNAVRIDFFQGSALVLRWLPRSLDAEAIEVAPTVRPDSDQYFSPLSGAPGRFVPLPRSGARLGDFDLSWGDRRIDFANRRHPEASLRFWFSNASSVPAWVLASGPVVAGTALAALVRPRGVEPVTDYGRLARMLATGADGHA